MFKVETYKFRCKNTAVAIENSIFTVKFLSFILIFILSRKPKQSDMSKCLKNSAIGRKDQALRKKCPLLIHPRQDFLKNLNAFLSWNFEESIVEFSISLIAKLKKINVVEMKQNLNSLIEIWSRFSDLTEHFSHFGGYTLIFLTFILIFDL